ncbi:hypothetical protein FRC09_013853 [Ceratobasidium sp. 395]|nr:hypothetical protein FRC09_013853 [Ceratobasidium sp. 395]
MGWLTSSKGETSPSPKSKSNPRELVKAFVNVSVAISPADVPEDLGDRLPQLQRTRLTVIETQTVHNYAEENQESLRSVFKYRWQLRSYSKRCRVWGTFVNYH